MKHTMPKGENLDLARYVFEAIDIVDAFHEPGELERVTFNQIYAYAADPEAVDPAFERAIQQDNRLQRELRHLLQKIALAQLPRAVAASTGGPLVRESEECRVRVEASRAEPSQVYIIVELKNDRPAKALFISDQNGGWRKFQLPEAVGNVIQVLVEANSEMVRLLQNHETEIYLSG